MGRIQELQPTELHEGNVAAGELDLQRPRMMPPRGRDHSLEPSAPRPPSLRLLALRRDIVRLLMPSSRTEPDEARQGPARPGRSRGSWWKRSDASPITAFAADRMVSVGAVVAVRASRTRAGSAKCPGKSRDVAHFRRAEGIYRLGVVGRPPSITPAPIPASALRGIEACRRLVSLVLVDEDMVEAAAEDARRSPARHTSAPTTKIRRSS